MLNPKGSPRSGKVFSLLKGFSALLTVRGELLALEAQEIAHNMLAIIVRLGLALLFIGVGFVATLLFLWLVVPVKVLAWVFGIIALLFVLIGLGLIGWSYHIKQKIVWFSDTVGEVKKDLRAFSGVKDE